MECPQCETLFCKKCLSEGIGSKVINQILNDISPLDTSIGQMQGSGEVIPLQNVLHPYPYSRKERTDPNGKLKILQKKKKQLEELIDQVKSQIDNGEFGRLTEIKRKYRQQQREENQETGEGQQQSFAYALDPESNSYILLDIHNRKPHYYSHRNNSKLKILPQCASTQMGSRIFLTGGLKENDQLSSTAIIIDTETNQIREAAPMKHEKYKHKLLSLNPFIAYSLGGQTGDYMNQVERYSLETDSWDEAPFLNEPKCLLGG